MKDRFRSSIGWALANGVIPALGAVLVIAALNHIRGDTLMTPGWAAAWGVVGGCLGGLLKPLVVRLQRH